MGMFNHNHRITRCESNITSNVYARSPLEKVNLNLCKYSLGVSKRAPHLALYGDLGRYPLYIDTVCSMVKYWLRLHDDKCGDHPLKDALKDNLLLFEAGHDCWIKCLHTILRDIDMIQVFNNPLSCKTKEISLIKHRLQQQLGINGSVNLIRALSYVLTKSLNAYSNMNLILSM